MTVTTGFFDAVRQYSSAEFARFLRALSSNGVVLGISNTFAVTAGPGLGVTVDTGFGAILGYWYYSDATQVVALATADLTNPRIDRIILRLTISTKTVILTKLTGTPAGSPVAPSLTQGADVYEIPLAQVAVAANAVSITSGNLTDQRTYAGPTVHDLITSHAASGLTTGHVMRATGASSFAFGQAAHTDLSAIGTNTHAQLDTHLSSALAVHGLPAAAAPLGDANGGGEYIRHGGFSVSGTAGASTTIGFVAQTGVTFAVAFPATPRIFLGVSNTSGLFFASVNSAATTGFTPIAWGTPSTANTGVINWLALTA